MNCSDTPTNLCPLCNNDNQCQVDNPAGCWCQSANFTAEVMTAVKKVNPARDRCVCPQCISSYSANEPSTATD